jgi:hypothetical protein
MFTIIMICNNCKKRWFGIMVELCETCREEESEEINQRLHSAL